jgi:hypothetical protein
MFGRVKHVRCTALRMALDYHERLIQTDVAPEKIVLTALVFESFLRGDRSLASDGDSGPHHPSHHGFRPEITIAAVDDAR